MDNKEPWYVRYGGGYLAYLWFIVYALILAPPALIDAIASYGWYFYFWSLVDRYPWVLEAYLIVHRVPFGWTAPYLAMGLGAFPVFCLLFFLGKTSVWQSTAGKISLVYTGVIVAFIWAGMSCSSHRVLGEY